MVLRWQTKIETQTFYNLQDHLTFGEFIFSLNLWNL